MARTDAVLIFFIILKSRFNSIFTFYHFFFNDLLDIL
uniref:Uncharacterized protein n=1 Tax=Siphoviridae sp. ctbrg2 TaxID=2823589 RepID=A0A8S5LG14_9CAUD|nr:MAG TPA: hypothetical protein [Siphoviridae sp. ctbrg2]